MNTNTDKPARLYEPGAEYVVMSDKLELPKDSHFTTLAGLDRAGQLAMIKVGRRLTVGRYYSDVAGCDWIVQPGLIIQVTGKIPVRVVGPVLQAA